MSRWIGTHEIIREATLGDGSVIALVCQHEMVGTIEEMDGTVKALVSDTNVGWAVELGLTGDTVVNEDIGVPVPVTTNGCVWCGEYEDMVYIAWDVVLACSNIRQADRQTTKWWKENMCYKINRGLRGSRR